MEVVEGKAFLVCESRDECKSLRKQQEKAWRQMPALARLWNQEPWVLSRNDFRRKLREEGLWFTPSLKPIFTSRRKQYRAVLIADKKLVATRWNNDEGGQTEVRADRIEVAAFKFLCLMRYDQVLEQEKAWRRQKYRAELRDHCALRQVKDAEYRAIRNADMCVSRAYKLVCQYFRRHPELALQYAIFYDVARRWENANLKPNRVPSGSANARCQS